MENKPVYNIYSQVSEPVFIDCDVNIYGVCNQADLHNCTIKNYGRMDYIRGDIKPEVQIKEVVKVEY